MKKRILSDAMSKNEFRGISKEVLTKNFKFNLFEKDEIKSVYTYFDRVLVLGAIPIKKSLDISKEGEELNAKFLLENREIGIANLGKSGIVVVNGEEFSLQNKEAIYIGKGNESIILKSESETQPAIFYMVSTPAHKELPTKVIKESDAKIVNWGDKETLNERVIFQLIHPANLETCQLSMGITCLKKGSVWNTYPPHTHERRMECYLYFDMDDEQEVYHFMGEKDDIKVLVMRDKDCVINPPWSVHYGVGTKAYNFVWAMAGENKDWTDMDFIDRKDLV